MRKIQNAWWLFAVSYISKLRSYIYFLKRKNLIYGLVFYSNYLSIYSLFQMTITDDFSRVISHEVLIGTDSKDAFAMLYFLFSLNIIAMSYSYIQLLSVFIL